MILTASDKAQVARIKECTAKRRLSVKGRDINELSDGQLAELTPYMVTQLKGVVISESTLKVRIREGMDVRKAATHPPTGPKRHKPTRQHKKQWNHT